MLQIIYSSIQPFSASTNTLISLLNIRFLLSLLITNPFTIATLTDSQHDLFAPPFKALPMPGTVRGSTDDMATLRSMLQSLTGQVSALQIQSERTLLVPGQSEHASLVPRLFYRSTRTRDVQTLSDSVDPTYKAWSIQLEGKFLEPQF
jgi:hypothetical protein